MNGLHSVAVEIYQEDLKTYRNNGRSYHGLLDTYRALKDTDKVGTTKKRFNDS